LGEFGVFDEKRGVSKAKATPTVRKLMADSPGKREKWKSTRVAK